MSQQPSGGTASAELKRLTTESGNTASADLDTRSAFEIAQIINREDARVAGAVEKALPQIATAIDWIAEALRSGGRLLYVGAGTSGRIGALDAAECPPTFDIDPKQVQFVMAGGPKALGAALEPNEDSPKLGRREIAKKRPGKKDIVIGITASGRTPFTVAAIEYARRRGARTVAVVCNPGSPLERAVELAIVCEVGPEAVAGSTRMKAGTAQKMVLNLLSTGAMTRLGYVYGNLMVNVHLKNKKLVERGVRILMQAANVDDATARKVLRQAGNSVPVALVMCKTGVGKKQAEQRLKTARGHVRRAIERAGGRNTSGTI
ncbi:MAG TPA: N-acetylmuramic acid 6-phosphate etherase [Terriglobales bacterium]|nr:N-acetylmuramic acid 6-phosphate etherase [Terriglobales bacterium]